MLAAWRVPDEPFVRDVVRYVQQLVAAAGRAVSNVECGARVVVEACYAQLDVTLRDRISPSNAALSLYNVVDDYDMPLQC